MALHIEKCDLLALRQRQVPPGERLCRRSEHRWWHAACLSEQSGSDSGGHSGLERSIFAAQPRGNRLPKSFLFSAPRNGRTSRRAQRRPCRSLLSNGHRNLQILRVATPVETPGWSRPPLGDRPCLFAQSTRPRGRPGPGPPPPPLFFLGGATP